MPDNPMVPNAPGWWLLVGDGIRAVLVGTDGRYTIPGGGPEWDVVDALPNGWKWGGQLVPRADLDAARAEERRDIDPYRAALIVQRNDAMARIAELEAKVAEWQTWAHGWAFTPPCASDDEARHAIGSELCVCDERVADEARRAALREAADDLDRRAREFRGLVVGILNQEALKLREKAEAAT